MRKAIPVVTDPQGTIINFAFQPVSTHFLFNNICISCLVHSLFPATAGNSFHQTGSEQPSVHYTSKQQTDTVRPVGEDRESSTVAAKETEMYLRSW